MRRKHLGVSGIAVLACCSAIAAGGPACSLLRAARSQQAEQQLAAGDPIVALARAPGSNLEARGRLFAAVWEDGTVVFSEDGSGTPESLRVSRADTQWVRGLRELDAWTSLCAQTPLQAYPPDSGPFVLRMRCDDGVRLHRWWREENLDHLGETGSRVRALRTELQRRSDAAAQPLLEKPGLRTRVDEMFYEPGRLLHP